MWALSMLESILQVILVSESYLVDLVYPRLESQVETSSMYVAVLHAYKRPVRDENDDSGGARDA